MSYAAMEEAHLTYLKMLDGLEIPSGLGASSVIDLSFNDFISAKYLVDKKEYMAVYTISDLKTINYQGIKPIRIERNLAYTLRKHRVDTIVSLGGSFRFQPIHDVVFALHSSLQVGGKLILAIYPEVYDDQGTDVLGFLSKKSELPVKSKLTRWNSTLFNSINNIFVNVRNENVITDASASEIKNLFTVDCFKNYLFKSKAEYENFFLHLEDNKRYYFSWKIIKALKV